MIEIARVISEKRREVLEIAEKETFPLWLESQAYDSDMTDRSEFFEGASAAEAAKIKTDQIINKVIVRELYIIRLVHGTEEWITFNRWPVFYDDSNVLRCIYKSATDVSWKTESLGEYLSMSFHPGGGDQYFQKYLIIPLQIQKLREQFEPVDECNFVDEVERVGRAF